jgi:hydroxymethylbilane synthase
VRLVRLATRGSRLALAQSSTVAGLLEKARPGVRCETVVVSTRGDRRTDIPAEEIPGGPGVFTKEAQEAVLEGRADAAVHSAKDLPTEPTPGLVIAAVPERVDPRDALVIRSEHVGEQSQTSPLQALPEGAVVATDSPRRRAQLLWHRPDLRFALLRGNIETRLDALTRKGIDALVLAMAGLLRLGLAGAPGVHPLEPAVVMPAMGQGALAVEAREEDADTKLLLADIDIAPLSSAVMAERAAIRALAGGCQAAAGALSQGGRIEVVIARGDGSQLLRAEGPLLQAEALAVQLLDLGGRRWLAS